MMETKRKTCENEASSIDLSTLKTYSVEPLLLCGRRECPKCGRKRAVYCYDCLCLVEDPALVPHVDLPIDVHILQHPQEKKSKSTAPHLCLVAPDRATIKTWPSAQQYDPKTTVILFPSDDALAVDDLDFEKIKTVLFLDCTWHQTRSMLRDESFASIPKVKIEGSKSRFWRYHRFGQPQRKALLSTIEAVYIFFVEYFIAKQRRLACPSSDSSSIPAAKKEVGKDAHVQLEYDGRYDGILFFFRLWYDRIQSEYQKKPGKKFRHIDGYIQGQSDGS